MLIRPAGKVSWFSALLRSYGILMVLMGFRESIFKKVPGYLLTDCFGRIYSVILF